MDKRFADMLDRLPEGEPKDWPMQWKLRTLAAGFQTGEIDAKRWPVGYDVQIDLLDIADWIEEAARRLSNNP